MLITIQGRHFGPHFISLSGLKRKIKKGETIVGVKNNVEENECIE